MTEIFVSEFGFVIPYPKASELCIEIVSPSNSKIEMQSGANEVCVASGLNEIQIYSCLGQKEKSDIANTSISGFVRRSE